MHASVMQFGQEVLLPHRIAGKRILEVGALNVNGSLRDHCTQHNPALYIGVDMVPGPGVDVILPAEHLSNVFAEEAFDLIICTEMLEHAEHWYACLAEMISVLRLGGTMLLTTRSPGFPLHNFPHDWWRFDLHFLAEELRRLGMNPLKMRHDPDPKSPGVFYYLSRDMFASRTCPIYSSDIHPHEMR